MASNHSKQSYQHERVKELIEANGPPLAQCEGSDQDLFNRVQAAAECACDSEGLGGGPLCAALAAGQLVNEAPFSCMIDLIVNHSDCDKPIPIEKRVAAYEAFSEVTGYKQADLGTIFDTINGDFTALVNFNAFYAFGPTAIAMIILIALMMGFKKMTWELGFFLIVFAIVLMYSFSAMYRMHVRSYLNGRTHTVQEAIKEAQLSFENSIAYWPQGLFAAACAVTSDDWTCNEVPECPPCAKVRRSPRVNLNEEDYEAFTKRRR